MGVNDSTMTEYRLKDVAEHATKEDLWIVVHGQVLDVTKYLSDHPGGADILIECAGTDATTAFEDAGHSEDATEIMKEFQIATLAGAKQKTPAPTTPHVSVSPQEDNKKKQVTGTVTKTAIKATLSTAGLAVPAFALAHSNWPIIAGSTSMASSWWTSKSHSTNSSALTFASGFVVASSITAIVAYLEYRRIAPSFSFDSKVMNYPKTMKSRRTAQPDVISSRGFLEPKIYQELPLVEKTEAAPNVYRLVFALPTSRTVLGLPCGQHVAIRATIDGQSVSRSYTPVSNNTDHGVLELIIRCYPDGLLTGKYLQHLKVGDEVEFRGPKGPMRYRRGLVPKIGMIAGGTGITPMFQLIRAICEDDEDLTEISLVYANRSERDMLLRDELDSYARRYPKNLKVWYMLDKSEPGWAYGTGYVTRETVIDHLPAAGDDVKMMICGPPGLVTGATKNLVSLGFKEPGAVAKMQDQIFLF